MPVKYAPGALEEAVWAVQKCNGSIVAAAKLLDLPATTLRGRYEAALRKDLDNPNAPPADSSPPPNLLEPEVARLTEENERLKAALSKAQKPHFTLRQELRGSATKIKLVCIGDAHDSPAIPDKSRFEWIGAYINDLRPDIVVQIGDFFTFDSLNTHIPNENYDGRSKPSFRADIGSGHLALQALGSRLQYKPEMHETDGNHERRLYQFEQTAPETVGMMQADYDSLLANNGWTHSPYGATQFYGGVGFVHIPLNTLGKTYGGKNPLPTIANDSIHDICFGHGHRERFHRAPKLGGNNYVCAWEVGCALPQGHIEDYAKHALTGWSYGIASMDIQHGHIQGRAFVTMAELEERYGRQRAA